MSEEQEEYVVDQVAVDTEATGQGMDVILHSTAGQPVDKTKPTRSTAPLDSMLKEQATLFSLPPELLDIIFELAYPRIENLRIMPLTLWKSREQYQRRSKGSSYIMRTPPAHMVDDWLVSRSFCVFAARAFVGNQVSDSGMGFPLYQCEGIGVMSFTRTMVLRIPSLQCCEKLMSNFPHLRSVTALMHPECFESTEPRFAWEFSLTEDELEKVADAVGLNRLFELREFYARPGWCVFARMPSQSNIWKDNVTRLEAILRKTVTRGRPDPGFATWYDDRMLYPGSKVYMDPSRARNASPFNAPMGPRSSFGINWKHPVRGRPTECTATVMSDLRSRPLATPADIPTNPEALRSFASTKPADNLTSSTKHSGTSNRKRLVPVSQRVSKAGPHAVPPQLLFQPDLTLKDIPTDLGELKHLVNTEPEKLRNFLHGLRIGGFDTQLLGKRPLPPDS